MKDREIDEQDIEKTRVVTVRILRDCSIGRPGDVFQDHYNNAIVWVNDGAAEIVSNDADEGEKIRLKYNDYVSVRVWKERVRNDVKVFLRIERYEDDPETAIKLADEMDVICPPDFYNSSYWEKKITSDLQYMGVEANSRDVNQFLTKYKDIIKAIEPIPELVMREEQKRELTPEERARAEEIIHDPYVLRYFRDTIQIVHRGEVHNCLLVFGIMLSKNIAPQQLIAVAQSGAGKNHLLDRVAPFFTDSIEKLSRTTGGYLERAEGDLNGRIIYVGQHIAVDVVMDMLNQMFTDGGLSLGVLERQPDGSFKPTKIVRKGKPAFVSTLAAESRSKIIHETRTRIWIVTTDETENQTDVVLDFEAEEYAGADTDNSKEVRDGENALNRLEQIDVVIPYTKILKEMVPKKHVAIRRHFPKILDMIKIFAWLHQHNRPRAVKKNGEEVIVATFADAIITWDIIKPNLTPTITGLTPHHQKCIKILENHRNDPEDDETYPMTKKGVAKEHYLVSNTVGKYLSELVDFGFVLPGKKGTSNIYELAPNYDEGTGELFDNVRHRLEERFTETEFEEWRTKYCAENSATNMTYMDMSSYVYLPVAEFQHTSSGSEGTGGNSQEEAAKPCGIVKNRLESDSADLKVEEVFLKNGKEQRTTRN